MNVLTISIVTYKHNFKDIEPILQLFFNLSKPYKIFIIDNSPTNDLYEKLKQYSIEYIFNNNNLGYGAGHNIAIKKSMQEGIKYHLVLNPDIIIESDVLDKLLEQMENNKDIGLIMPHIKYPDGQTQHLCKLLATPIDLIGRRFIPFKKWNEERNNKYELRFTEYNKIMQVPSLSGCFMLLRTDVLKVVGSFDERFFMYCEDFDLCRRVSQVSKTIFYPDVSVIHNYEKGSYKLSKLLFYHIHSAFKYFNKWGWFFDKERRKINRETLNALEFKR